MHPSQAGFIVVKLPQPGVPVDADGAAVTGPADATIGPGPTAGDAVGPLDDA
jgi:hypothetical protein